MPKQQIAAQIGFLEEKIACVQDEGGFIPQQVALRPLSPLKDSEILTGLQLRSRVEGNPDFLDIINNDSSTE